ncbi:hypothetical protein [Bosea sp. MMO-172]|uniref:hypothetical protein n=1 Tax=Bosea sp. MMO-172 TaxID=3127885 RepID=UPI00301770CC
MLKLDGIALFVQCRRLWRRSPWNRALEAGKITAYPLDPATYVGSQSYISPTARLADGRSHFDRTAATVIGIIRGDVVAPGA